MTYYLLHLGCINNGYHHEYNFALDKVFIGSENECKESFLSDMKQIYTDQWSEFCPNCIQDLEVKKIWVSILVTDKISKIKIKPIINKNTNGNAISLQLLNYSTNGGLNSGFGAILLPKGESFQITVIFDF